MVERDVPARYSWRVSEKYPSRLYHKPPPGVSDNAVFHIRIRVAPDNATRALIHPDLAPRLLESVHTYFERNRWSCFLFVVMPDHLHALMSFGRGPGMARVVGDWKSYHARAHGVRWQENFFDHRIRNSAEYAAKFNYIERNPVALGLCAKPEDWSSRTSAFSPDSTPKF